MLLGSIADRGTQARLHGVRGLERSWFAQPILHNIRGAGCRALHKRLCELLKLPSLFLDGRNLIESFIFDVEFFFYYF